ncbi:MAG: hypothetical protein JNJ56_01270 [Ignavibacteria bacterium]|nr:hypothetical protein [Ignavibacteria bacterium]
MKTINLLFLLAVLLISAKQSDAQQFRLNLYSGYNFDDDVEAVTNNYNYFNGTIKGNYQWGLGFEYIVKPTYGIELLYYRMDTDVDVNYNTSNSNLPDSSKQTSFGLGSNFIMLAGNKYLPIPRSIVYGYGSLMAGLSIMTNKDPLPGATEDSKTSFAWGGKLGFGFNFSKSVGLTIYGSVLSAVQNVDGGFYLGTGGVGAGLNSESSMYQFGLGGALVFKFGQSSKPKLKR